MVGESPNSRPMVGMAMDKAVVDEVDDDHHEDDEDPPATVLIAPVATSDGAAGDVDNCHSSSPLRAWRRSRWDGPASLDGEKCDRLSRLLYRLACTDFCRLGFADEPLPGRRPRPGGADRERCCALDGLQTLRFCSAGQARPFDRQGRRARRQQEGLTGGADIGGALAGNVVGGAVRGRADRERQAAEQGDAGSAHELYGDLALVGTWSAPRRRRRTWPAGTRCRRETALHFKLCPAARSTAGAMMSISSRPNRRRRRHAG